MKKDLEKDFVVRISVDGKQGELCEMTLNYRAIKLADKDMIFIMQYLNNILDTTFDGIRADSEMKGGDK